MLLAAGKTKASFTTATPRCAPPLTPRDATPSPTRGAAAIGLNKTTVLRAIIAELEAGLIGERTKAALAAAKQRGVRLGSYGAETLAPKYRAEAKVRAEQLAPLIREMQKDMRMRALPLERSQGRLDPRNLRRGAEKTR